MFYASFKSEVDTFELMEERIERGLPVVLPKTLIKERRLVPFLIRDLERDLLKGAYGIQEPNTMTAAQVDPKAIDMVLVPGSAFDTSCNRSGYGGGFYDRFLSNDAPQALRVGLAFSFQVLESITVEPHDQPLDIIITDSFTITCKGRTL